MDAKKEIDTDGCRVYNGDALSVLKSLDSESVNCCVTSPPYWCMRDYGIEGQIGLESTPEEYVNSIVDVFHEVRRVLCDDGVLWLNLGDTYTGGYRGGDPMMGNNIGVSAATTVGKVNRGMSNLPPKNLVGIPWRVAFALQSDGWILRQDIVWHKPNAMPESIKDRCTKSHEYIFLLSKKRKYYFDNKAIREKCSEDNVNDYLRRKSMNNKGADIEGTYCDVRPDLTRSREDYMPSDFMRNKRSVWSVNTKPYKGSHFASWPTELIKPCILAGCPEGGVVLDPFHGTGTTGEVALKCGAKYVGIELNPEYIELSRTRMEQRYLFK